jgi:23S rRNA (adenine2030-N6)-methyltransferase
MGLFRKKKHKRESTTAPSNETLVETPLAWTERLAEQYYILDRHLFRLSIFGKDDPATRAEMEAVRARLVAQVGPLRAERALQPPEKGGLLGPRTCAWCGEPNSVKNAPCCSSACLSIAKHPDAFRSRTLLPHEETLDQAKSHLAGCLAEEDRLLGVVEDAALAEDDQGVAWARGLAAEAADETVRARRAVAVAQANFDKAAEEVDARLQAFVAYVHEWYTGEPLYEEDPKPKRRLANPHFGNVGDVFKHLLVAELAACVKPPSYLEAHAGAPAYQLPQMRRGPYDAIRFNELAQANAVLQTSAFVPILDRTMRAHRYWGSGGLVLALLGNTARYVFFDDHLDTIHMWEGFLGQLSRDAEVILGDGISGVVDLSGEGSLTVLDPFDVKARGAEGLNSVEAFTLLARRPDQVTVLWYPVTSRDSRMSWPGEVSYNVTSPLWRAELRLPATAPGLKGCGVLIAGISEYVAGRLGFLVEALGASVATELPGAVAGYGWDTEDGASSPWTPHGVYRPQ